MKSFLFSCFFLFSFFILTSCGTPEDNAKSKAMSGSVDQVIARGGSIVRDQNRAFEDSQHRLQSGGGLFSKKGNVLGELLDSKKSENNIVGSVGLPINPILWQSSIDVIEFMPIASTDAFSGIIITDWYSTPKNPNEKCKINIFIKGLEFKSSNLKVNSFCQQYINNSWIDINTSDENDRKIENAILNKAKKIKLAKN